jgi:glycosyltransferase involved in cell wall biosynthesis
MTALEQPRDDPRPRTSVAVAVCTCERNGPLAVLLDMLVENAARVTPRAAVGVVIVDDSRDGGARDVAARYEGRFELGLHYRVAGQQNISLARNLAVETAAGIAQWVAMTDDDCEPQRDWLERLLETQQRTAAHAVAGNYRRRAPAGAPPWLTDEPFLEIALMSPPEGAALNMAGTNNSLISAAWWKEHPQLRFDPSLGKAGGEDVVFYRTAYAAGLRIHAAPAAIVFEEQPPSRTTFRYQLWHFFWMGNSSFVTRRGTREASPARMVLQGGNHMRRALVRSLARVLRGRGPHARYCLASLLFGTGMMLGALGLRVSHH